MPHVEPSPVGPRDQGAAIEVELTDAYVRFEPPSYTTTTIDVALTVTATTVADASRWGFTCINSTATTAEEPAAAGGGAARWVSEISAPAH